jgi:hypothetical protein
MPKPFLSPPAPFSSKLPTGAERFLCQIVVHALETGFRTAEDFVRHFPPRAIIESLAGDDALRSDMLIRAAKVHAKLAPKKSVASGTEDLAIALAEGIGTPQEVLEVYDPDSRVKYLEAPKLWAFVTEGGFWNTKGGDPGYDKAHSRLVFTLERALAEGLLTLSDIGDGITFGELAKHLPLDVAQRVVLHALMTARADKRPLDEASLLEAVPLPELTSYLALSHTWEGVVVAKVARPKAWQSGESASANASSVGASPAPEKDKKGGAPVAPKLPGGKAALKSAPAASADSKGADVKAPGEAKPAGEAKHETGAAPDKEDVLAYEAVDEGELEEFDGEPPVDLGEESARKDAIERLQKLERLPPSSGTLSLPVLLSIESMYQELEAASTDEAREQVIRESFPNESHLRQAMLALIELLDSTIDTKEPLIRDADIDSLIKIVLFEERRRWEKAHPSQRPGSIRPRPFPSRADK